MHPLPGSPRTALLPSRSMGAALLSLLLACALLAPPPLSAQGCSQCRDNVAQTSAELQNGYREAILLMLGASITLFSVALLVLRRQR